MKVKTRTVSGLVLLMVLGVVLAAGAVPIVENFDGAAVGKAPAGWEDGGDVKATSIVVDKSAIAPHTPPNCLKMVDDSPGGAAQITRWFGDVNKGTVAYAAYVTAANPGDLYCTLKKGGENVVDVMLSAGGNVKYRDQSGSTRETGAKYALDAWHILAVSWDVPAGKFAIVCDGAKVGEYPVLKAAAPDTLVYKLGASNKVGMVAYVDSIELIAE